MSHAQGLFTSNSICEIELCMFISFQVDVSR